MEKIILGIDPGSTHSGLITLKDGKIIKGDNIDNEGMFTLIDKYSLFGTGLKLMVVYEDIRPFTSRFNMDTINTCKIIGRLEYILKQQRVDFIGISRNEVKSFVFNNYPEVVIPYIEKKIEYRMAKGFMKGKKDGTAPAIKFTFVDDRAVYKSMSKEWGIEQPKPGKKNIYGISKHAWQALGVVTTYLNKLSTALQGTGGT